MSRQFHLRVFGCQMNQHDAEKISNLFHHMDYRPTSDPAAADVVVIHTCSVREKAEQKLYSELGSLLELKREHPSLVVGVGGCVAQQEGAALLQRFSKLDFVFGPQNLREIPALVDGALSRERALRIDYPDQAAERFDLPERHPEYSSPTPGRAFVTVMEGCDLFCAFCVVPTTRGREVSRPSGAILSEVRALAERGVVEVTLLGQTVNAYGRPRPGRALDELPFAELIRRIGEIAGIERIRFTSPHPAFVTQDLIDVFADLPSLCPHLHLPVQSGSSRVLAAMNRRYDRDTYLSIVERLRAARPDIALTTDLIVGFPGETVAEFEQTLDLVQRVAFVDSFSFKFSPRPGTPVLRRGLESVPADESQRRLGVLQELQRELTLRAHRARIGTRSRVLVEGGSRRGGDQQTGRCPYNRVVNFTADVPLPLGRMAELQIVGASPHSLLAVTPEAHARAPLPLL